jgi:hypothetical protein
MVLGASVLLSILSSLPARADYQADILAQQPVGYWRLNETTAPVPAAAAANLGSLGTAASGIYENYPTRALPGPFTGSLGIGFDGVNQDVYADYSIDLNPATFTFETWVNPATDKPAGNLTCMAASMHSASPRSGWLIYQSGGAPDTAAAGWELRLYAANGTATSLRLLVTNGVASGTWSHLVFTFDGTTAKGYLNGILTAQGSPTGFVPNPDAVFDVGMRSDGGFPWNGQTAEVAYYGSALTEAKVKTHFDASVSNPAGYQGVITADAPLVYYRFREAADPVAANIGSFGSDANGLYVYKATPGQAGPRPPTTPGLDAGNTAVVFDGTGGSVNLPALLLGSDTVTMTAWVKANGAQQPATGLILCRANTTVAGITFDAVNVSGLELAYNWNDDPAAYNWVSGLSVPDGEWAFVALAVQPDKATLFSAKASDPLSFNSAINPGTHAPQNFEGVTTIGTDSLTNSRSFNGAMDEVTVFDRTLTPGEVYSQFASALGNLGPKIFTDPQSPSDPVYAGDPITFTVDAGGTPSLTYQWRKGSAAITGATTSAYTIPSLATSDSGTYDVVITNPYGNLTSQGATIVVNTTSLPTITQDIQGRTIYPGGSLKLTVVAAGGALKYQWQKDGSALAGATNATYLVSSAAVSDAGAYKVVVTNRVGTVTSATADIVVVNPATGSYAAAIVADSPESWWRLDEPVGSTSMLDAMARHDGQYVNNSGNPVTLGVPGIVSGDSDTAALFDGSESYGSVPYSADLNNTDFTIEVWAKTTVLDDTGLCPASTRFSTKGCWFYTYPAGSWSGGVSSGGNNFYVPSTTPDTTILSNQWTYLVMTFGKDTTGASTPLRYYVNGAWDGQGYVDFNRNAAGPLLVGARGGDAGTAADMFFKGAVDEVAVYKHALTAAQIKSHYDARFGSTSKPTFVEQPKPATTVVGNSASFSGRAQGSAPLSYQWYKDGTVIVAATNTTLTITSAQYTDIGNYKLVASNPAGNTDSTTAVLTVVPPIAFANATNGLVLHLKFDGSYSDSSGRGNNATAVGSPTFVAGQLGQAFQYTTRADGSADYATLGVPNDLLFSSNVSFSVSYWIKVPANSLSGDLPILGSATGSYSNPGLTFAPSYKLGGWSWSLGYGTTYTGLYGADGSINNGNWHHLLHSFDRAGGLGTTYLDGVEVDATSIASVGDVDTAGPFNIGQDPTGAYPEPGTAAVDDLGIWRRALTATEAYAIWYAGANSGASFDTYGPVTMAAVKSGNNLLLIWQAGTLLESTKADGPWTPVVGATAPNYTVPIGTDSKFYKVQL